MSKILELTKQAMEEQAISTRELAKALGYSHPAMSQYLNGKYGAGSSRIEAALIPWLRKQGKAVRAGEVDSVILDTRSLEAIQAACTSAYEEGSIVAVIGPPGCGKSVGLRKWEANARAEGWPFISIQANVVSTPVTMLRRIGEELDIRHGNAASLLERIIDALKRKPSFLIVDEAQHLSFKILETLRAISDATLTGIVFSGSLALERTLLHGDSTSIELAQVQDRIVEVVRVGTLTPVEVSRFVREMLPVLSDGEAVAELREVSRSVPRRVVRLLAHLRKLSVASKAPITAGMVREAGERLVAA